MAHRFLLRRFVLALSCALALALGAVLSFAGAQTATRTIRIEKVIVDSFGIAPESTFTGTISNVPANGQSAWSVTTASRTRDFTVPVNLVHTVFEDPLPAWSGWTLGGYKSVSSTAACGTSGFSTNTSINPAINSVSPGNGNAKICIRNTFTGGVLIVGAQLDPASHAPPGMPAFSGGLSHASTSPPGWEAPLNGFGQPMGLAPGAYAVGPPALGPGWSITGWASGSYGAGPACPASASSYAVPSPAVQVTAGQRTVLCLLVRYESPTPPPTETPTPAPTETPTPAPTETPTPTPTETPTPAPTETPTPSPTPTETPSPAPTETPTPAPTETPTPAPTETPTPAPTETPTPTPTETPTPAPTETPTPSPTETPPPAPTETPTPAPTETPTPPPTETPSPTPTPTPTPTATAAPAAAAQTVTIRVRKTLSVIGFSSPGAGWEFTLEGCGVGPLAGTTDANGVVEFPGLPPAVGCSYTVTETVQAGWVPQYVSQQVQPREGGSTATVEFLNIREFNPPCVDPADPRCQPPEFATPTPPATPAPPAPIENPASTPSPSPTTAPATPAPASPSPSVTSVSGASTGPTPRPPAAGTGPAASRDGAPVPAAGALVLAAALGLACAVRRR